MNSATGSEMSRDVREGQTLREHEDLQVVQQLRDLLGGAIVALVLRGHPHLGGHRLSGRTLVFVIDLLGVTA